ncbi:MAG: adenine-specific DNA-methyltransferase [Chloroflexi bacterium AL-W]|nr:adenine-specific DNA-methyltransferase [Chloroflexi bacterium AL-N1]NOK66832.1 adenine-specific DNA-methyltransferase [Chloroflexi bacterium AL-N10]NOK74876.1 adenine-specific DNA-methyltransferase [Chloroflexi bacterium AL-N5]NOK81435.1 adenine-specific DNA-methyltransferase [Chloroflexi bacterium AL-W]NOK88904.1 adenine-specific DNA-methyltransferase [Chloroflexi bacterium AL-N15]
MIKYEQHDHIIYHGDALATLRSTIETASVDLIFVDPPYNIGKKFADFKDRWPSDAVYAEWAYAWIDECIRVLKPSGTMYLMTSTQAMPYLDLYIRERLTILSRIVWSYDSSGLQAKKYYGSMYEPMLHCVKDAKAYTFNVDDIRIAARTGAERKLIDYRGKVPKRYSTTKVPENVWHVPRVRYRMDEYEDHPAQKPQALLERIVRASSHAGDTVLDPFAGTFTTAAVAQAFGRKSISIESQAAYLKIGLRRVLGFETYQGECLARPVKNTRVRNGRGLKKAATTEDFCSVTDDGEQKALSGNTLLSDW